MEVHTQTHFDSFSSGVTNHRGFFIASTQGTHRDTPRPRGGVYSASECIRPLIDKLGVLHPCKARDGRLCPPCARRSAEQVRNTIADGLELSDAYGSAIVTLTNAPSGSKVSAKDVLEWNENASRMRVNNVETVKRFTKRAGLIYEGMAWVAETQRTGAVHFHMLPRISAPEGITLPGEVWGLFWDSLQAHLLKRPTHVRMGKGVRLVSRTHVRMIAAPMVDAMRVGNYLKKSLVHPASNVAFSRVSAVRHLLGERLGSRARSLLGYRGRLWGHSRGWLAVSPP